MLLVLYSAHMTPIGPESLAEDAGQRRRLPPGRHHWQLSVEQDGQLTAMLAGSEPPLTVSGESLASLRSQIRAVTLRGLL